MYSQEYIDDLEDINEIYKYTLSGNDLLTQAYRHYDIINDNNLQGKYRIIILDLVEQMVIHDEIGDIWYKGGQLTYWWNGNKNTWGGFIDSGLNTVFNQDLNKKIFIITKNTRLPVEIYEQKYLRAVEGHCFFNPIIKWNEHIKENGSKSSARHAITALNHIKKGNLLEKYKDGVSHKDIPELCTLLRVGVDIEQPFKKETHYTFRPQTKPRQVLRFINTELNHVEYTKSKISWGDIYVHDEITLSNTDMKKLLETLDKEKTAYIYSGGRAKPRQIKTLENCYKAENPRKEIFKEFEKETGLIHTKTRYKDHQDLKTFMNLGMRYNGGVNFMENDFEKFKGKTTEELLTMGVRHYDQEKAYTKFKSSKYYSGFLGHITDFREIDHHNYNGFYYITDLDTTNYNEQFREIEKYLYVFNSNSVYTKQELDLLEDNGGKFKVLFGAYGSNIDFEFPEYMLDKIDKVPHYSIWTGLNGVVREESTINMRGDKQYFQVIQENTKGEFYYNEYTKEGTYSSKSTTQHSNIHISSQIVAYQRINMIEQLLNMDLSKLIRVYVDGIYTYEENPILTNDFISKTDKLSLDSVCGRGFCYSVDKEEAWNFPTAKARDHYLTELFIGQGGNGKTHYNLIDSGFINLKYYAPTYKLCMSKKEEYGVNVDVINGLYDNSDRLRNNQLYDNVRVIDEASMISEEEKKMILKNCKGKVIFCGDIGFQIPPFSSTGDNPEEMNEEGFDNIQEFKTNYRFKENDPIRKLMKKLRKLISNGTLHIEEKNMYHLGLQHISINSLKEKYTTKDIILARTNKDKDYYTKLFSHLDKYYVKERSGTRCKGDIILTNEAGVKKELRHGFTFNSVQGETFKDNIYIHPSTMDLRGLYTALSRGKSIKQLYIITDKPKTIRIKKN